MLRWLPSLRPYPAHDYGSWDYYDAIYAITHVVYSYNHYNLNRISPECFPAEFDCTKTNLPSAIHDNDPELLGEYVDSLRAFGFDYSYAPLRDATDYSSKRKIPTGKAGEIQLRKIRTLAITPRGPASAPFKLSSGPTF